jgi:hypothetical protein
MKTIPSARITALILASTLVCAAAACMLPDDTYMRWQLLHGTIHANARWFYERTHFDDTPIDVVFIGPSRMKAGVDAPRLENELKRAGLPDNVVNFSLLKPGRDIDFVVVKQLLAVKQPKLIVLGVLARPSRLGNEAFRYLADPWDVVCPGYLADVNYAGNLVYLPYRQIELFAARFWPETAGFTKTFDPARYAGHSIETAGDPETTIEKPYIEPKWDSKRVMEQAVRELRAQPHPPVLPSSLWDLEFGDERHYVHAIMAMARARHVDVAFVFIPYYSETDPIQEAALYRSFGPLWEARFLAPHAELFEDYGHLAPAGARRLTDWLFVRVAARLRQKAAESGGAGAVR